MQCERILQGLRCAPLTISQAGFATNEVQNSLFDDEQKNKITEAIAQTMTTPGITPQSQPDKFQQWERLWEFMPYDVWLKMGHKDFCECAILFLLKMGLRKPSEGTYRVLAVGFMLGGEEKKRAMQYTDDQKTTMLKTTKDWFKMMAAKFNGVPIIVHSLPHGHRAFTSSIAEKLYGSAGAPAKCALPDVKYHELLNKFRCRRSNNVPQAAQTNLRSILEAFANRFSNIDQPRLQGLQFTQLGPKPQDQPALAPKGPMVPWTNNVTPTKLAVSPLSTVPWPAASLYMLCSNRTGRSSLAAVSR